MTTISRGEWLAFMKTIRAPRLAAGWGWRPWFLDERLGVVPGAQILSTLHATGADGKSYDAHLSITGDDLERNQKSVLRMQLVMTKYDVARMSLAQRLDVALL